jgi:hypothetical protein
LTTSEPFAFACWKNGDCSMFDAMAEVVVCVGVRSCAQLIELRAVMVAFNKPHGGAGAGALDRCGYISLTHALSREST